MNTLKNLSDFVEAVVGSERFQIYVRKDNPSLTVIIVPDAGVRIELEEYGIQIVDAEVSVSIEDWRDFTNKVNDLLLETIYQQLLGDFEKIRESADFFKLLGPFDTTYPANPTGKKISLEDLNYTCLHVFAHRLASCSQSAESLASDTRQAALANELAIGILLRTAVLDSILIMGWLSHPEIASALAVDSLQRISKIKGSGKSYDTLRKRFNDLSSYFNAHNLSNKDTRIGIENILERMPNTPNLSEYRHVYEYYSKYDHFSLIPYIIKKSEFGYLFIMVTSMHLIKHAFCAMVCIYLPEYQDEFEQRLKIKFHIDKDGNFSFDT